MFENIDDFFLYRPYFMIKAPVVGITANNIFKKRSWYQKIRR